MRSKWLGIAVMCAVMGIMGTTAVAAFEPLFRVIKVTGECSIQRPDDADYSPAEESKAYPYGTKVRTGMRSSLIVVFSEGNVCRVLANAQLTMAEGIGNQQLKIIRLQDGEVEVDLEEDFHKDGNALNVETATAICGAIGCKFRVASKVEEDLRIVIVRVLEGLIKAHGENFAIQELDQGDWMSFLSPPDNSFLRIKTMKGDVEVTIKEEDGSTDKVIPTVEGTVLKIWQRQVPGTDQHVVTVVITGPDGQMIETITATYGEGEGPNFGEGDEGQTPPWGEQGSGDEPDDQEDDDEDGGKGHPKPTDGGPGDQPGSGEEDLGDDADDITPTGQV